MGKQRCLYQSLRKAVPGRTDVADTLRTPKHSLSRCSKGGGVSPPPHF